MRWPRGAAMTETAKKSSMKSPMKPRTHHPECDTGDSFRLNVSSDILGPASPRKSSARSLNPSSRRKKSAKEPGLVWRPCIGIVNQHQGWIELDNEIGCGARPFRFFCHCGMTLVGALDARAAQTGSARQSDSSCWWRMNWPFAESVRSVLGGTAIQGFRSGQRCGSAGSSGRNKNPR